MQSKKLLLGVTGGIAAYKSVEIVRRVKELGYDVRVVMTSSAMEFVGPLTFQAVSGNPVHHLLVDCDAEASMGHIELAKWADQVLIAPATANFIAKLAHGIADDLLSTLCLATAAPIAIAPAMNQQMWAAEATQANLRILKQRGLRVLGPAAGEQACGDVGLGRMLEPLQLVDAIAHPTTEQLKGQHWVITAGPTREQIDPVRFLSNNSSGKMGYALARAALNSGATVTLISGPVSLESPAGVETITVKSAVEMLDKTNQAVDSADVFIACAAVADYRPKEVVEQKIKKNDDSLILELVKNPDILAEVSARKNNRPLCVGFAAETENIKTYAQSKMINKKLDMICANDVSQSTVGFDADENALLVLCKDGSCETIKQCSKSEVALQLIQLIKNKYFN